MIELRIIMKHLRTLMRLKTEDVDEVQFVNVSGVFFSGHILCHVVPFLSNAVPFIECKMYLLCIRAS